MASTREPLVLVVEDNPQWQQTLELLLRPLGVRILLADDYRDGLRKVEQHSPNSDDPIDIVILDMRLPDPKTNLLDLEGGIRFIKEYKYHLSPDVPIIVYSAYPDLDNCVKAVRAGACTYLPKESEEGRDRAQELYELCHEHLMARAQAASARWLPDENWFERHNREIKKRYAGHYAVFVAGDLMAEVGDHQVSCELLGGVKVLAAISKQELKRVVFDNPELRERLPNVVFIEKEIAE